MKQQKKKDPKKQAPTFSKPLPSNVDAEKLILGALLMDSGCAPKVFSVLKREDFFMDTHRKIFTAMQTLIGNGSVIDLVPLIDYLKVNNDLEASGGAPYVASLMDGMPKVSNVNHYAEIVREKAVLRNLIHSVYGIWQKAFEGSEGAASIVEKAISDFLGLATLTSGPLSRKWYDVAQSAMKKVQNEREFPENAAKINSGLEDLDDVVSGFRKKELVVIVGPTSNGKTLLASQFADQAEKDGYTGIIFSAEMPGEQIVLRQIAYDAKIPFWKTRFPEKMDDQQFDALMSQAGYLRRLIIVEHGIRPMNIWAISKAKKLAGGLDFIVIDYDQLVIEAGIDPDEDEDHFFRHQRRFILEAKHFAEDEDICVIMLSQLRKVSHRIAQGGRPQLDDIYGDSSIRNTPDVIIWVVRQFFMHGFKKEFEDKATAFVVKARNGRVARVDLKFDSDFVRLLDMPPSEKDSTVEREVKNQTSFNLED